MLQGGLHCLPGLVAYLTTHTQDQHCGSQLLKPACESNGTLQHLYDVSSPLNFCTVCLLRRLKHHWHALTPLGGRILSAPLYPAADTILHSVNVL